MYGWITIGRTEHSPTMSWLVEIFFFFFFEWSNEAVVTQMAIKWDGELRKTLFNAFETGYSRSKRQNH